MLSVRVYVVTLVNESNQSLAPSVKYCELSSSFLDSLLAYLWFFISLFPSHIVSSSEANQNLQKYAAYPPVVAHVGACSAAGPSQRRSRSLWRSPSFSLSRSLRRPSDARATAEGASLPLFPPHFSPSRSECSRAAATDVFAPLFCGGGGGGTAEASLSLRRNKREKILIPGLRLAETALT